MSGLSKVHFFLITAPLVFWGYINDFAYLIILSEVLFSVACAYSDYLRKQNGISFITIYSVFTLTYCIGNFLVVNSIGTPWASNYDFYLVPDCIIVALVFTYIANVSCVLGFEFYQSKFKEEISRVPVLDITVTTSFLNKFIILLTVINSLVFIKIIDFNTYSPLLLGGIFFSIRMSFKNDNKQVLVLCIVNTFLLSVNGMLFAYLRMHTITPSIAFLIAVFFSKYSLRSFYSQYVFPVYILLWAALVVFSFLGEIRTSAYGEDKFTALMNKVENEEDTPDLYEDENRSFGARISNINQTSQIVKLVNDDGYYRGATLGYLAFAFIPRAIWKDKPVIAQGVWFALQIGQAYVHDDGKANNSINMTSAGELYLNFGLIGVIVGMFCIGALCAFMWKISGFAESAENILGSVFGLYLFYLATSTFGIDLQFLITLISYFLMFQLVNYAYRFIVNSKF